MVGSRTESNAVEVPGEQDEVLVRPDNEVPLLVKTERRVEIAMKPCELLIQPNSEVPHLVEDQLEPVFWKECRSSLMGNNSVFPV